MIQKMVYFVILWVLAAAAAWPGQDSGYPPTLAGAAVEAYKRTSGADLQLWIYYPDGRRPVEHRPAIVFFFGGGWQQGNPKQFAPHAEYFASRGMVAITADYRVASRHGVKAEKCVEDAKSAIRWVRRNSAQLGVDPNRIAAGGGSAGGHLAISAAVVPGFEAPGEAHDVSSAPNAVILFNPGVLTASVDGGPLLSALRVERYESRVGVDPVLISPYQHVRKALPPTIIFHGEADTTVPFSDVVAFAERMKRFGNRCELVGYPGAGHGFFNYGRGDGSAYRDTVRRADRFLASLGWLKGDPTL